MATHLDMLPIFVDLDTRFLLLVIRYSLYLGIESSFSCYPRPKIRCSLFYLVNSTFAWKSPPLPFFYFVGLFIDSLHCLHVSNLVTPLLCTNTQMYLHLNFWPYPQVSLSHEHPAHCSPFKFKASSIICPTRDLRLPSVSTDRLPFVI